MGLRADLLKSSPRALKESSVTESSVTESSVTESSISRFSLASAMSPLFSHVTRFMGYYFMCVYWPDLLKETWYNE